MGREEIYIRYIYHLAELHNESSNWVEAGFTLLLHAQLLQVTKFKLLSVIHLMIVYTMISGLSQCKRQRAPILDNQVLNVKRPYIMTSLNTLIKEK